MPSVELDISRHCQELDREDRETEHDERRQEAVDEYLVLLALLPAVEWSQIAARAVPCSEWTDDDDFWRMVGEKLKVAVENGLGI
jgi:hypothetical protein